MKKVYLIFLSVVLLAMISLFFVQEVKNEVVFYTYGTPITKLIGTSVNEKELFEVKSPTKISKVILSYDDTQVNTVQKMEVEVMYKGLSFKNEFDFVIVDQQAPVIEYHFPSLQLSSSNFNLDDYLFIYDPSNPQVQLELVEPHNKYYGLAGYSYACQDTLSTCMFNKGSHEIHITAWDGHGNETSETIQIELT